MMLLSIFWLLGAFLGYASSQVIGVDINGLPVCAQGCLVNNTASATGCAISDIKCICSSIAYINALSCCLENACSQADQKTALAFDIALCATYNVSIPDFLGCSPLSSTVSDRVITTATSSPSTLTMLTMATAVTITNLESVPTIASGGAVAQFTGGLLLTGSCTTPAIASASISGGGVLEFPWVGCADQAPDCCPFNLTQAGPLSVCPGDYFTTNGGCCPSGWSIYSSTIAGKTPCYTTPAVPLIPTSSPTQAANGPSITAISNELFTLRYDLASPQTGLPVGTKVGIGVGFGVGACILAAVVFCALLQRRRRANMPPSSTGENDLSTLGTTNEKRISTLPSRSSVNTNMQTASYIPELPSPEPHSPQSKSVISPLQSAGVSGYFPGDIGGRNMSSMGEMTIPAMPPMPAQELPGSTFIHEHHPAMATTEDHVRAEDAFAW